MRGLGILAVGLAMVAYGLQASAQAEHDYNNCYAYGMYSYNGTCQPVQVLGTPAFILPSLTRLPDGNGNDQVVPTTLSKSELKNASKALDKVIKSSTNSYSNQSKMAADWEFQNLATFMKKHPGGSCSNAGVGMVCTGGDGKSSTYNFLTVPLVSRALAKKDGDTVTSYNSRVTNTVAAVNANATAAYNAYLTSNAATVSVGQPSQTAFADNTAPAAVLPQNSPTTRDPAAAVSVSYQGQSTGISH